MKNCHAHLRNTSSINVREYRKGNQKWTIFISGYIQTNSQKNKKIKRADQILPEVYGTTLKQIKI
jgi:hypothetical protein